MCEICENLLQQVPPAAIAALEEFVAEAEALGAKVLPKLVETGLVAMLDDSFTDEEKAAGKDKRIAALYGLVAIAGFTANSAYHEPDLAQAADSLFELSGNIGWATGHQAANAIKN